MNVQAGTNAASSAFFPRRTQVLFDWLGSSLVKQAKSETPRPEVFLAPEVWTLLDAFLEALLSPAASKKRKMMMDMDDYRKCFDSTSLVIKVPLLFVFQVSLQLVSTTPQPDIERVILGFLLQNRSSLPVNMSQIIAFIKMLCTKRQQLTRFTELLRISLSIFGQIIASGAANYKKSYPSILQFALDTEVASDEELWIDCWQRCLFPEVDELCAMLKGEILAGLMKNPSKPVDSAFPKTVSIQKLLLVQLSTAAACAPRTLSSIYEAFLRAAEGKVDRESGFNFLAFLISRCPAVKGNAAALAALLAVLHSRGNEIYQQRNDDIYRAQSEIIQNIFEAALKTDDFLLLLQIARLNYYLVLEKFSSQILPKLNDSEDAKQLLGGMFELATQANQMPSFVSSLLAVNAAGKEISFLNDREIQTALAALFSRAIPLSALQNIFTLLAECDAPVKRQLIRPVLKNVDRLLDARLLPKDQYFALQRRCLETRQFDLLVFLVRWTPTHLDLDDSLFEARKRPLALTLALKFKNPARVSVEIDETVSSDDLRLIVDYLPVIAGDCSRSVLKKVAKWLITKEPELLSQLLKNPLFFEIEAFRKPFLSRCKKHNHNNPHVIASLPAEYFDDDEAVELAQAALKSDQTNDDVMRAVLISGHFIRCGVLEALQKEDSFVDFLLRCSSSSSKDDLISKCVEADKSGKLLRKLVKRKPGLSQLARALKYSQSSQFEEEEAAVVVKSVLKLLPSSFNSASDVDDLGVVLEWLGADEAAKLLSKVKVADGARLLALQLRFCPEKASIAEALQRLRESTDPAVQSSLRKGLVSAVKQTRSGDSSCLDLILQDEDTWLSAIGQLLNVPGRSQEAFAHFFAHFDVVQSKQLLPVLKSACQLKRGVTWSTELLARVLGKLRSRLITDGENVCSIWKTLVSQHWWHLRRLSPLFVSCLTEALQMPQLESPLARVIHELGALKIGDLEPFSLLPLLHAFCRSATASRSRPIQLAMNSVMRHFSSQSQLLQLLSSALIVEEEQRLVLRAFLDEYNKFYKFTGRA